MGKAKENARVDFAWAYANSEKCAPTLITNTIFAWLDDQWKDSSTKCRIVPPLMVSGMTGENVEWCHGFYDVADRVCDGWVTYRHRTKETIIEYYAAGPCWHIKPYEDRGIDSAYAYIRPKDANNVLLPHEITGDWQVWNNGDWETQALCVDVMYYPILVSGVTGGNSGVCNGTFYAQDEECNGWVKYKKRHEDVWMVYDAEKGQWCIQPTDKPGDDMYANVPANRVTSPDRIKSASWQVWNVEQAKFIKQPDMYLQPNYEGDW